MDKSYHGAGQEHNAAARRQGYPWMPTGNAGFFRETLRIRGQVGKPGRHGGAGGLVGENRSPEDYIPGRRVPWGLSMTAWLTTLPFSTVIRRYFS
jgi:hypothetical protein